MTTNPTRKAELKLLFADKRLGSAKILFGKGKYEEGMTTLTKSEKYLEEAIYQEKENRNKGIDTSEFLNMISRASLMHYQVMEEIKINAPEEVKPLIISTQDYPRWVFEQARNSLLERGIQPPKNPFGW